MEEPTALPRRQREATASATTSGSGLASVDVLQSTGGTGVDHGCGAGMAGSSWFGDGDGTLRIAPRGTPRLAAVRSREEMAAQRQR